MNAPEAAANIFATTTALKNKNTKTTQSEEKQLNSNEDMLMEYNATVVAPAQSSNAAAERPIESCNNACRPYRVVALPVVCFVYDDDIDEI